MLFFCVLKMVYLSIRDSINYSVEVFIMNMAYYKEFVLPTVQQSSVTLHLLHIAQLFGNREHPPVYPSDCKVVIFNHCRCSHAPSC